MKVLKNDVSFLYSVPVCDTERIIEVVFDSVHFSIIEEILHEYKSSFLECLRSISSSEARKTWVLSRNL